MQRYAKFLIKQNKYVYTYKKKKNTSSSAIFAFRKNKQQSSQIKKETLGMTVMKRNIVLNIPHASINGVFDPNLITLDANFGCKSTQKFVEIPLFD